MPLTRRMPRSPLGPRGKYEEVGGEGGVEREAEGERLLNGCSGGKEEEEEIQLERVR